MEKLIVQRKVEVWIEDTYHVEEINKETIQKAIDYDIDYDESETLYDTMENLGIVEVYDENWNLLAQKGMDLTYE